MNAKVPVTINGIEYPSRTAAANALGVSASAVGHAIKRGRAEFLGCGRGGAQQSPNRKYPGEKKGYMQALDDFEELLDNAKENWGKGTAPTHYDFEMRDQIIILRDQFNDH